MIDDTGHRHQESMRQSPSAQRMVEFPYPLRGVINRIYYKDDGGNQTGQTVVDINLHGGYNTLTKVPLCTTKVNKDHGYEWTPDEGDGVIVQFVGGNWADPIITGYFPLQDNNIQAEKADAPKGSRRYHRKCNKTDLVIDKDGNRIEYVAKDETVVIHGHETITIETGNFVATISQGNTTITTQGNTTVNTVGNTDISSNGATTITSGTVVTIGAPIITLNATIVSCTGEFEAALNVKAGLNTIAGVDAVAANNTVAGNMALDSNGNTNHHAH